MFCEGYRDCSPAAGKVAGAAGGNELGATMATTRQEETSPQMLAEIYGWFTEGFDTKDLQEAKVLLEELA